MRVSALCPDAVMTWHAAAGTIKYDGMLHTSISSFALAVFKDRNPKRRACDGWREVKLNDTRMSTYRRKCLQKMMQAGHL